MTKVSLFNLISWLTLISIMSLIMTNTMHPIMLVFMVLIFNIIISINMSMWKSNYLASFMYFLIMISGLLIIFLYFSSLISNEPSSIPLNFKIPLLIFVLTALTMSISPQYYSSTPLSSINIPSFILPSLNSMSTSSSSLNYSTQPMSPMYSIPSSNLTLICMSFLLIVMISIIKICSPMMKSLRKLS